MDSLIALSPLDGRYRKKVESLADHFSEMALMRYRVQVEAEWFIALAEEPKITEVPVLSADDAAFVRDLAAQFSLADAQAVKAIEATTNHDVKAIEYWMKSRFETRPSLKSRMEFLHFACTSEDINNLSHGLMLRGALHDTLLPTLTQIHAKLAGYAQAFADTPMLARTHGQAATPTTMGKEFSVFAVRLKRVIDEINAVVIFGKMNGAVGNFNAHLIAYPEVDWPALSAKVIARLGMTQNTHTTQIEPHDYMASLFQAFVRANTILIDLSRDVWGYVAWGYFKQKLKAGEVDSSTMPHKVNPIDFENAEGNFGLANALLSHLAEKLPISRWQRDLTDSTVLRNMGVALGYSQLGYVSLLQGMGKLELNAARLAEDLDGAWEVLAEAIQTVMRRYDVPEPYEKLKALTRGQAGFSRESLQFFIDALQIPDQAKIRLMELAPTTYTGIASTLARSVQ